MAPGTAQYQKLSVTGTGHRLPEPLVHREMKQNISGPGRARGSSANFGGKTYLPFAQGSVFQAWPRPCCGRLCWQAGLQVDFTFGSSSAEVPSKVHSAAKGLILHGSGDARNYLFHLRVCVDKPFTRFHRVERGGAALGHNVYFKPPIRLLPGRRVS